MALPAKRDTVVLIAGERSGDQLGASLITAMRQLRPGLRFEGIGGPEMEAAGFTSHYPLERLAVMGLVEPLKRLPELLRIRRELIARYSAAPPALLVGIDAPDFNLHLEAVLRARGVRTAHYVSPSVWAWRQGRVRTIARAVDRMLTLFPHEAEFYREARVPVTFVGHPLADRLPLEPPTAAARESLGLPEEGPVIALLPGSRAGEVARLLPDFLEAARLLQTRFPNCQFVLPAASVERRRQIDALLAERPLGPALRVLDGAAHTALAASDGVLIASGTATLEAMLLKKPMVIAYKMAPLSFWLLRRLVKVSWVGLPNLLAGRQLVPELLQEAATPAALADALAAIMNDPSRREALTEAFTEIHLALRQGADQRAAEALLELMKC